MVQWSIRLPLMRQFPAQRGFDGRAFNGVKRNDRSRETRRGAGNMKRPIICTPDARWFTPGTAIAPSVAVEVLIARTEGRYPGIDTWGPRIRAEFADGEGVYNTLKLLRLARSHFVALQPGSTTECKMCGAGLDNEEHRVLVVAAD